MQDARDRPITGSRWGKSSNGKLMLSVTPRDLLVLWLHQLRGEQLFRFETTLLVPVNKTQSGARSPDRVMKR